MNEKVWQYQEDFPGWWLLVYSSCENKNMLLSCPDFAQINDETSIVGNIKILMTASHTHLILVRKGSFLKTFYNFLRICSIEIKSYILIQIYFSYLNMWHHILQIMICSAQSIGKNLEGHKKSSFLDLGLYFVNNMIGIL